MPQPTEDLATLLSEELDGRAGNFKNACSDIYNDIEHDRDMDEMLARLIVLAGSAGKILTLLQALSLAVLTRLGEGEP